MALGTTLRQIMPGRDND